MEAEIDIVHWPCQGFKICQPRISLNQQNAAIAGVGREKTDGLEYVFLKIVWHQITPEGMVILNENGSSYISHIFILFKFNRIIF